MPCSEVSLVLKITCLALFGEISASYGAKLLHQGILAAYHRQTYHYRWVLMIWILNLLYVNLLLCFKPYCGYCTVILIHSEQAVIIFIELAKVEVLFYVNKCFCHSTILSLFPILWYIGNINIHFNAISPAGWS